MTTTVTVALMVIFGAALIGKILMTMYPNSGFGASGADDSEKNTPTE